MTEAGWPWAARMVPGQCVACEQPYDEHVSEVYPAGEGPLTISSRCPVPPKYEVQQLGEVVEFPVGFEPVAWQYYFIPEEVGPHDGSCHEFPLGPCEGHAPRGAAIGIKVMARKPL